MRVNRRVGTATAAAVLIAAIGCVHTHHGQVGPENGGAHVAVPPPGAVPRELYKITLPPYVIAAPDIPLIVIVQRGKGPNRPRTSRTDPERLPVQAITGNFHVRLDGTVNLGFWGNVPVADLRWIRRPGDSPASGDNPVLADFTAKQESIVVIIDVVAYNSKRYYIHFDGGGFGEQVVSFPILGSETVLDAVANVGGLPDIGSKRNICRAANATRPAVANSPVDWLESRSTALPSPTTRFCPEIAST